MIGTRALRRLAIAGFVIALAWGTVFFPGWPWWVAAIVTAVVVLVVVGIIVFRRVRAARRAAALERELLRQADEQAPAHGRARA